MKGSYQYNELADTLHLMKKQICESLRYCRRFEGHSTPESLFNELKLLVTYVPDPPATELMHTADSLFTDNYHGIAGAGDCDDFTILAAAALYANNFADQELVLAGRSKNNPVHIFNNVRWYGQWFTFDLTQRNFGQRRHYPYYQYLDLTFKDC